MRNIIKISFILGLIVPFMGRALIDSSLTICPADFNQMQNKINFDHLKPCESLKKMTVCLNEDKNYKDRDFSIIQIDFHPKEVGNFEMIKTDICYVKGTLLNEECIKQALVKRKLIIEAKAADLFRNMLLANLKEIKSCSIGFILTISINHTMDNLEIILLECFRYYTKHDTTARSSTDPAPVAAEVVVDLSTEQAKVEDKVATAEEQKKKLGTRARRRIKAAGGEAAIVADASRAIGLAPEAMQATAEGSIQEVKAEISLVDQLSNQIQKITVEQETQTDAVVVVQTREYDEITITKDREERVIKRQKGQPEEGPEEIEPRPEPTEGETHPEHHYLPEIQRNLALDQLEQELEQMDREQQERSTEFEQRSEPARKNTGRWIDINMINQLLALEAAVKAEREAKAQAKAKAKPKSKQGNRGSQRG